MPYVIIAAKGRNGLQYCIFSVLEFVIQARRTSTQNDIRLYYTDSFIGSHTSTIRACTNIYMPWYSAVIYWPPISSTSTFGQLVSWITFHIPLNRRSLYLQILFVNVKGLTAGDGSSTTEGLAKTLVKQVEWTPVIKTKYGPFKSSHRHVALLRNAMY